MTEVIGLNNFYFFELERKKKMPCGFLCKFCFIFRLNFVFRLVGQLFSIDVLIRYMRQGSLLP